ncbi:glycoside hydrolase family 72 protein [Sporormia fimetaria CBS 119925]|uniref:1,3-beta-glucanosyltransferase n=1 Tax=Sporormia fimetaria CBS 119925 TaxID=1340428 RepID=A0A6A6UZT6_9PLEO|nr:glycoside hydrolase family 72 protein [Sporormia fimetaria CBS 119925]
MKSFATLALIGSSAVPAFASILPRQSNGKLEPVEVRGNAFFAGDERFYVRGLAYQPGGAADAKDPLLNLEQLAEDVANFKELGVNTIRIYTVDNSGNHDEGMKMLADAGIYLTLDANTPKYSINRETMDTTHRSYNDVYLQNVFATIDTFAKYDNMLAFFSGNEVINMKNNTGAAPYIKAVTRDMKKYMAAQNYRKIPVGYSAADVAENIYQQALFFDCGNDEDARGDFFAFNDYSWCDPSDFKTSGWDKKVELYKDYPVPIFMSEFGCNTNERKWGEIEALYSTDMTSVYSGGLVYEYTNEANLYGLVNKTVDEETGEITTTLLDDFNALKEAYAATPNPSGDGGYKKNGTPSKCPPADDDWEVESADLPKMPAGAEKFMKSGAGQAVGLAGDGSHFAGEPSESMVKVSEASSSGGADEEGEDADQEGAGFAVQVPFKLLSLIGAIAAFAFML